MIYIWVRTKIDWDDEEAFLGQLKEAFRPKVEVWNATFTIPYHVFRREVREIARLNLSRVENAVCAPWEEIPEGGLVLPVDDDDWFAPDVAAVLEAHRNPDAICYRWTASFLEVPRDLRHRLYLARRRLLPFTPERWFCSTNNYALVKQGGDDGLARKHIRASHYFTHEGKDRVKTLERRLSLMNRTLGSQTSIAFGRPNVARSQLVSKLERYRRLYRSAGLDGLDWAHPYVEAMAELTDRVRLRDR
jgi:hypothetical protein